MRIARRNNGERDEMMSSLDQPGARPRIRRMMDIEMNNNDQSSIDPPSNRVLFVVTNSLLHLIRIIYRHNERAGKGRGRGRGAHTLRT